MNKIETTVEGLEHLLECNLDTLLYSDKYSTVLSRHNNLIGFDVLNRLIIACQNPKAVILKTAEEWEVEGRAIAKNAKPVYIFNPQYRIEYYDTMNGERLDKTDLTAEEKVIAIRLGMVAKDSILEDMSIVPVYELYDTISISGEAYKVNKPFLSIKEITFLFKNITLAKVLETSNKMTYNPDTNVLYINPSVSYQNFVDSISLILAQWLIKNKLIKDDDYSYDFSTKSFEEKEYDVLKDSLTFAINSLFGGTLRLDTQKNSSIHKANLISILYIVDVLMLEIIYRTQFNEESFNEDAVHNVYRLKKTNLILNAMYVAYLQNI